MKRAAIDVAAKSAADERWITCVHEAGHAVVGEHFEGVVSFIEVFSKADVCRRMVGVCQFAYDPIDKKGRLQTHEAGRAAEYLVRGGQPPKVEALVIYGLMSKRRDVQVSALRVGDLGPDQEDTVNELRASGLKDVIGAFHRVQKSTWELVQELRPQIMALADALYARGRLDCADIDDVLEDMRDAA